MAIEILSPRYKSEWHQHSCVYCRKIRYEPNDCCKKTKIDIHKFPCLSCLSDYRRRFGALSDDLLDAYLSVQQREMVKHVAPDKTSDDLDERDRERVQSARSLHALAVGSDIGAGIQRDAVQSRASVAAEQTKELERAIEQTTETITWDEVQSEIEEMNKKEKF